MSSGRLLAITGHSGCMAWDRLLAITGTQAGQGPKPFVLVTVRAHIKEITRLNHYITMTIIIVQCTAQQIAC